MLNNHLDIKTRPCYWFESCSCFWNLYNLQKFLLTQIDYWRKDRQNKNTALMDEYGTHPEHLVDWASCISFWFPAPCLSLYWAAHQNPPS